MITRKIILDSFKLVRGNTIQVAKDIPEEKYDFVPAEGAASIRDTLLNIIRFTEFMVGVALSKEPVKITPETRSEVFARLVKTNFDEVKTKEQIVSTLQTSLDELVARVEAADESFLDSKFIAPDEIEKVRLWVVQCAKEQEMGYRAQLYLMERMIGIVPHTTRRQQAAQARAAK